MLSDYLLSKIPFDRALSSEEKRTTCPVPSTPITLDQLTERLRELTERSRVLQLVVRHQLPDETSPAKTFLKRVFGFKLPPNLSNISKRLPLRLLNPSLAIVLEGILRREPALRRYADEVWPTVLAQQTQTPEDPFGDLIRESLVELLDNDDLYLPADLGRVLRTVERGPTSFPSSLEFEVWLNRGRTITEAWHRFRERSEYAPFVLAYKGCQQALGNLLEALASNSPTPPATPTMQPSPTMPTTPPKKAVPRCTADDLAKVNVELVDLENLHLKCQSCGQTWSPNLRSGGRLPKGYWKCPRGCNKEAGDILAACAGGDQ